MTRVAPSLGPPDLSAAGAWLAARSATDRKQRGTWPTPWWVCEAVVDRIAPDLGPAPVVVDPACGDGRWLIAVARRRPQARLVGLDADPLAIEAARITLGRAGVVAELGCADALAADAVPRCDWVVGNPPFVRPQHLARDVAADVWARFSVATDKVDLSACFAERAVDRAPRAALVLPANLLSLASFAALRRRLAAAGVDGVFALPDDAFGATIRSVVVVVGPADRRVAGALGPDGFSADGALAESGGVWSLDG
ncbi:MAG: methyltransferase, partial [Myxococcota bacterium]